MELSIQAQPLQTIHCLAQTKFCTIDLSKQELSEGSEKMSVSMIYDHSLLLCNDTIGQLVNPEDPTKLSERLTGVHILALYHNLLDEDLKPLEEQLLQDECNLASIPLEIGGLYPYKGAKEKCLTSNRHLRKLLYDLGEFTVEMDKMIDGTKRVISVRDQFPSPPTNPDMYENLANEDGSEDERYLFKLYDWLDSLDLVVLRLWGLLHGMLQEIIDQYGLGFARRRADSEADTLHEE